MSNNYYFDYEPFAERIAQVITGSLTEDEFKRDFPEIEYHKVGEKVGNATIETIDKFMIKDRTIFQVTRTGPTSISILKVAVFGEAPTPAEEIESLSVKRNALTQRLAEYQVPNVTLINPTTFEPFDDETEEGRDEKNEYLSKISEQIRELDTKISELRVIS